MCRHFDGFQWYYLLAICLLRANCGTSLSNRDDIPDKMEAMFTEVILQVWCLEGSTRDLVANVNSWTLVSSQAY